MKFILVGNIGGWKFFKQRICFDIINKQNEFNINVHKICKLH